MVRVLQWVQLFMNSVGWEHYREIREEAGQSVQAITVNLEPHRTQEGSWFSYIRLQAGSSWVLR